MKKNNFTLIIFLLLGLLLGTLIAELLQSLEAISFMTKHVIISWSPAADLKILKYDFNFEVKLSLMSFVGLILFFWIYKKV